MAKEHFIKMEIFIVETSKMIISTVNCDIKEKMDKCMMENGNKARNMDMAYIIGLTEAHIKANI